MNRLAFKLLAIVAGISGLVIMAGVIIPIAGYETFANKQYPTLLSPLVEERSPLENLGVLDDTKASNWFPVGTVQAFENSNVEFFTVSVPKLKIENATVAVGGEELDKSLIQYPGTALPGKTGNTVIFGHSILPIFYDPQNYMAIFSTLHTLKPGDDILISYDGVSYKYEVEDMKEVLPTQVSVLDQDPSGSYISLITCTPPGDPRKPKRLVVKARLVPFGQAYANTGN